VGKPQNAETHLQVINIPLRVCLRVDFLVVEAARTTCTGEVASVAVETKFQAEGVHVVSEGLDAVWELLRIGNNLPVRGPFL
jgi:hypothetical protein